MITIENLGKRYRLGNGHAPQGYVTFRESVAGGFQALLYQVLGGKFRWWKVADEFRSRKRNEFWALREVSFAVGAGEVIGIIGRNGAGKSTLLKILSRITDPTEGRVRVRGRVASLLEVGTGFHPELTGRENIFLNGAILGMSRAEIRRKFDEIVAFAEVEPFLDTPVKRYSSGMYVRLAFSVAAHLEPEVLIVDEVLAVGDSQFQRKCLGKMQAVSRGGRTVLFVSHNMAAVQNLCRRAVYLRNGQVGSIGTANDMVREYLSDGIKDTTEGRMESLAGAGLRLARLELRPNPVHCGASTSFVVSLEAKRAVRLSELALLICTEDGTRVAIVDLRGCGLPQLLKPGQTWEGQGTIRGLPLVEGVYRLGIYLCAGDFTGNVSDLIRFTVLPPLRPSLAPYAAAHRGILELDVSFNKADPGINLPIPLTSSTRPMALPANITFKQEPK